MLLYGLKNKLIKDIWAGTYQCPNCGRVSHFHLVKLKLILSIFFIPCFSKVQKRFLVCDCCEAAAELSKKDYKARYKEQIQLLENQGFPTDVILNEYSSKELKLIKHFLGLILSGFFALLMDFSMFSMMSDIENIDVVSVIFILVFCALFTAPFLVVLKNLILKIKKFKLYKLVSKT